MQSLFHTAHFLMPAEPTEGVHLERCNAFMWFVLMLLLICLSLEG